MNMQTLEIQNTLNEYIELVVGLYGSIGANDEEQGMIKGVLDMAAVSFVAAKSIEFMSQEIFKTNPES